MLDHLIDPDCDEIECEGYDEWLDEENAINAAESAQDADEQEYISCNW